LAAFPAYSVDEAPKITGRFVMLVPDAVPGLVATLYVQVSKVPVITVDEMVPATFKDPATVVPMYALMAEPAVNELFPPYLNMYVNAITFICMFAPAAGISVTGEAFKERI